MKSKAGRSNMLTTHYHTCKLLLQRTVSVYSAMSQKLKSGIWRKVILRVEIKHLTLERKTGIKLIETAKMTHKYFLFSFQP